MGRDFSEAGGVECSLRDEVGGTTNVLGEGCSMWNGEYSERHNVEDGTSNVLEDSWGQRASGRNLPIGSVEERAEEIKWNVYDERSICRQRATDYSVNSEESGYSSLKDRPVGIGWGKQEEEEEERILKIREEEVMLKELVRIAKEEEKEMEKLKKAEEQEQQKLEEAKRAHESIIAIEAARKVRQAEAEDIEKARKMRAEEKRLKDKDHRARKLERKKKQIMKTKRKTQKERGERKARQGRSLGHGDHLEAEGETESTDGKDEHSKPMSKQLGNTLGIQAHESKTVQELPEKGGGKITKEAGKRHEAQIAKSKQNGEKAKHLWPNKKKQDIIATVANNQRERLEKDVEVQSKLFSQDQGTRDVSVSSNKNATKYSGENPNANPLEELTHKENGVRASGEEPEVQFFAFINCFNICSGKVIQIC